MSLFPICPPDVTATKTYWSGYADANNATTYTWTGLPVDPLDTGFVVGFYYGGGGTADRIVDSVSATGNVSGTISDANVETMEILGVGDQIGVAIAWGTLNRDTSFDFSFTLDGSVNRAGYFYWTTRNMKRSSRYNRVFLSSYASPQHVQLTARRHGLVFAITFTNSTSSRTIDWTNGGCIEDDEHFNETRTAGVASKSIGRGNESVIANTVYSGSATISLFAISFDPQ